MYTIHAKDAGVGELRDELKKLHGSMADLRTLCSDLEVAAAAYDTEKRRLESELEVLKGEVGRIQAEKDASLGMVQAKDAEVGELRDELKKLHGSMADLHTLCSDLKGKSSSLQDERDSVLKALEKQKAEADELRLTLGELDVCNGEKDREIRTLKAEVEGKGIEISHLNGDLEQLQLAVAEAQRRGKNEVWRWLGPATTSVLAAASFVYAARSR